MVGLQKHIAAPDGQLDNNSPSSILSSPESLDEFAGLVLDLQDKDLTETQLKSELQNYLGNKKEQQMRRTIHLLLTYMFLDMILIKNLSAMNKQ